MKLGNIVFALGLYGCSNESNIEKLPDQPVAVVTEFDPDLVIIPPEEPVEDGFVRDVFYQNPSPRVDALFVVDDSGSMGDHQSLLSANLPRFYENFVGSGLDYHLGVITTDMEDPLRQGQLIEQWGFRFVTPETQDEIDNLGLLDLDGQPLTTLDVVEDLFGVGTNGSGDEQGLDAVMTALTGHQNLEESNHGFLRDDADLHVVLVSDEDDVSTQNHPQDVVSFFNTLRINKTAEFHSIVERPGEHCGSGNGTRYIQVSQSLSGLLFSLCSGDWSEMIDQLGFQTAGLSFEFYLSQTPNLESLEAVIEVEEPEGSGNWMELYSPEVGPNAFHEMEYFPDSNSLRFRHMYDVPPPNSRMIVNYEVASE